MGNQIQFDGQAVNQREIRLVKASVGNVDRAIGESIFGQGGWITGFFHRHDGLAAHDGDRKVELFLIASEFQRGEADFA